MTPTRLMRLTLILITMIMAVSCDPHKPSTQEAQQDVSRLTYQLDTRTGLCFAVLRSTTYASYQVATITVVPTETCSKDVR